MGTRTDHKRIFGADGDPGRLVISRPTNIRQPLFPSLGGLFEQCGGLRGQWHLPEGEITSKHSMRLVLTRVNRCPWYDGLKSFVGSLEW